MTRAIGPSGVGESPNADSSISGCRRDDDQTAAERRSFASRSPCCCSAAPRWSPCTTGSGSAGRPRLRDRRPALRRDRPRRRRRLPARARAVQARAGRLAAARPVDPLLGSGRGLLDGLHRSNPSAPYPSPADVGYLAFYPLAYAGLAMLVRARTHETRLATLDGRPDRRAWHRRAGRRLRLRLRRRPHLGTTLEMVTSLAYPLGDIAMLAMVVGVVALTGWRPGPHLVAAAGRPGGAGRRRHRLHAAGDRRRPPGRRTGSTRST